MSGFIIDLPIGGTLSPTCDFVVEEIWSAFPFVFFPFAIHMIALFLAQKRYAWQMYRVTSQQCGDGNGVELEGPFLPSLALPRCIFFPLWLFAFVFLDIAAFFIWKDDGQWCIQYVYLSLWMIQVFVHGLWPIVFFCFQSPGISTFLLIVEFIWCVIVFVVYILGTSRSLFVGFCIILYSIWIFYNIIWNALFYSQYKEGKAMYNSLACIKDEICGCLDIHIKKECIRNGEREKEREEELAHLPKSTNYCNEFDNPPKYPTPNGHNEIYPPQHNNGSGSGSGMVNNAQMNNRPRVPRQRVI
jgi:tryptophan-rich sensory protein